MNKLKELFNLVEVINEIDKIIKRDNLELLTWSDVCKHTDFDSVVTALAYGLNWEKDMLKITEATDMPARQFLFLAEYLMRKRSIENKK